LLAGFITKEEVAVLFAAIFALVIGVGMIAQWVMSYVTKQIPELKTEPIRIAFHIAAEMATALLLIVSGVLLLLGAGSGVYVYLVASGMLFYTSIVSPGYFAQQGKWGWLVMFSIIILAGILSVIQLV